MISPLSPPINSPAEKTLTPETFRLVATTTAAVARIAPGETRGETAPAHRPARRGRSRRLDAARIRRARRRRRRSSRGHHRRRCRARSRGPPPAQDRFWPHADGENHGVGVQAVTIGQREAAHAFLADYLDRVGVEQHTHAFGLDGCFSSAAPGASSWRSIKRSMRWTSVTSTPDLARP